MAEQRIERMAYDTTHEMFEALEKHGVEIDDNIAAYARACAQQVAEVAESFRWREVDGDG